MPLPKKHWDTGSQRWEIHPSDFKFRLALWDLQWMRDAPLISKRAREKYFRMSLSEDGWMPVPPDRCRKPVRQFGMILMMRPKLPVCEDRT